MAIETELTCLRVVRGYSIRYSGDLCKAVISKDGNLLKTLECDPPKPGEAGSAFPDAMQWVKAERAGKHKKKQKTKPEPEQKAT